MAILLYECQLITPRFLVNSPHAELVEHFTRHTHTATQPSQFHTASLTKQEPSRPTPALPYAPSNPTSATLGPVVHVGAVLLLVRAVQCCAVLCCSGGRCEEPGECRIGTSGPIDVGFVGGPAPWRRMVCDLLHDFIFRLDEH